MTIAPTHPIRPIGARLLVRPIATPRDESKLIQEIDEPPITQGDVLRVGHPACETCGAELRPAIRSGQRVLLRPGAIVRELEYEGETLWMVDLVDVVAELEPLVVVEPVEAAS